MEEQPESVEPPVIAPLALGDAVPAAHPSPETLRLLARRRSTLAKLIAEPGPSQAELDAILQAGARVPDHRRLEPWRFVVIRADARQRLHELLCEIYAETQQPGSDEERVKALQKLASIARAPVTICVVSTVRSDSEKAKKTPEWEQHLSAGAVCQTLLIAANASGYAAQWVTEWYAYEPKVHRVLGLTEHERVAGFVFLGTATQAPLERKRPQLDALVHLWNDGARAG